MSDWNSKHYKEHNASQESAALRVLGDYPWTGSERVLDIGCGDGKITRKIATQFAPRGHTVGIDLSPAMIREARAAHGDIANLSFHENSADRFAFDEPFDLVVSFFALHWVKDHRAMLQCVKRSLAPNGRLLFVFPSGGNSLIGEVFMREPWRSEIPPNDRYQFLNETIYRALLPECGLIPLRAEMAHFHHIFPNGEALANNLMTWLPYATALPNEKCLQLAHEIADNIAHHQKRSEDLDLPSSTLFVEASSGVYTQRGHKL